MEGYVSADVPGEKIPSLITPDEDLRHVLDVLNAGGYGAWVVGGAVRDSMLGLNVNEYDICTDATPEEVIESFEDTIPTGQRFGTITVKSGDKLYEVTTLRTEITVMAGDPMLLLGEKVSWLTYPEEILQ